MEILIASLIFGGLTGIILIVRERIMSSAKKTKDTLNNKYLLNNGMILVDYSSYSMSVKEYILYSTAAGTILFLIGYIFYQNYIISLAFALIGMFYPKFKKADLIKKQKLELLLQFKQALYSLSTSLVSGRSIENAFKEVINDLKLLYPNSDTYIIKEFTIINHRIENGEPIEKALLDFSSRADIEDITNFADVFATCKRTGGDIVEVVRRTANIIGEKIEIEQEINVLIAQKKFEARILTLSPYAFVAVISFSSPDYMAPLYEMGIGPVIMTISLFLLLIAYLVTKKIMDIKV